MPAVVPAGDSTYRPPARGRVVSFVLSAGVVALLFLIMVRMGAFAPPPGEPGARLVAIDLSADDGGDATPNQPQARKRASRDRPREEAAQPVAPAVPPPAVEVPATGWIEMTREEYAAADIGRFPKARGGAAGEAGPAAAAGGEPGQGSGEGPGGARLYNAEWYRNPTRAELAGFLPPNRGPGEWAMIACRTVEKFRVEDCQELDESPRGSGLARGLRRAAWQFMVRPPRVNGKPLVGAWVRIRFDFTRDGAPAT